MHFRSFAGVLATLALLASGTASAAVINYSAVIDLDPSMLDANGLDAPLPGGPIAMNVGDTLQGVVQFANQGRITVSAGDIIGAGKEWISGSFSSSDPGATAGSSGMFQFLGLQGDYLGPAVITSADAYGGLVFSKVMNYTDTSFSFSGFSFVLTYIDNRTDSQPLTTHVTPGFFSVSFAPASISEGVPEPATWAMMTLGFGAIGVTARRRRTFRAA